MSVRSRERERGRRRDHRGPHVVRQEDRVDRVRDAADCAYDAIGGKVVMPSVERIRHVPATVQCHDARGGRVIDEEEHVVPLLLLCPECLYGAEREREREFAAVLPPPL